MLSLLSLLLLRLLLPLLLLSLCSFSLTLVSLLPLFSFTFATVFAVVVDAKYLYFIAVCNYSYLYAATVALLLCIDVFFPFRIVMDQSRCSVAIIDAVALVPSVGLVDGGVAEVVVAFVIDGAVFAGAAAVAIDVGAIVAVDANAVAVCYLGSYCCRRFSLLLLLLLLVLLMQVYRYALRVCLAVTRLTIYRQLRI